VGGEGRLVLAETEIDLARSGPFLGLAREALLGLRAVAAPDPGLLLVENLAAFEACCRGEVEGAGAALFVWTAGYPGRAVRSLTTVAAEGGGRVRVWADLDLDGVRIARLAGRWAPVEPFRMSPEDLAAAPARRPLPARRAAAIEADLESRPDAPLAETLRAILDFGEWAEQEAFL